jgi:hypothetical protein
MIWLFPYLDVLELEATSQQPPLKLKKLKLITLANKYKAEVAVPLMQIKKRNEILVMLFHYCNRLNSTLQKNTTASPAVQKRNPGATAPGSAGPGSGSVWKMSCLRPAPPTRHYLGQIQEPTAANRRSVSINKKPQKGEIDFGTKKSNSSLKCINLLKLEIIIVRFYYEEVNYLLEEFHCAGYM